MKNVNTLRQVLPRVDRIARRQVVFGRKKIGSLKSVAQEAKLDTTDQQIFARYARQTFSCARILRDKYALSNRTEHAMVLIGFVIGALIGFVAGLVVGAQYIGLLAAFIGVALSAVLVISIPFLVYYSAAYLRLWWNLASERRKFLRGLEGA